MAQPRVLIVAGTHPRENEFSYSVADKLVEAYGKKAPDYFFQGVDSARRGRLWLYENIAVAKINRIGDSSEEYLRTLSHQALVNLAYFKLKHEGCKFPPTIEDQFENIPQWTSVSQQLVDASDADIYLDLHSFHAYSQLDGTGLYLVSHASQTSTDRIKKSLDLAKKAEPAVYDLNLDYNPDEVEEMLVLSADEKDKIEKLNKEYDRKLDYSKMVLTGLDQSQLINLLRGKVGIKTPVHNLISELREVSSRIFPYEDQATSQKAKHWKNSWYLKEGFPDSRINRFTFEAVHWQGKQQEAVVNFITKYLIPQ